MAKVLLEICCGSLDDALESQVGGADRVELCSALFLGGLTPSAATITEARARLKIPFVSMVRPRSGGFCYSDAEMSVMERDAEFAIASGADGIVFGVLREDSTVDVSRCKRLRSIARERQAVFHRAFDVMPEPFRALDQLVDLGITRILTSGQRKNAGDGTELIKRLIDYAKGRIEILPGGGIEPENIRDVVACTGCNQVHLTAFKTCYDRSTQRQPEIAFGAEAGPPETEYELTDRELVRSIVGLLA